MWFFDITTIKKMSEKMSKYLMLSAEFILW